MWCKPFFFYFSLSALQQKTGSFVKLNQEKDLETERMDLSFGTWTPACGVKVRRPLWDSELQSFLWNLYQAQIYFYSSEIDA